MSESIEELIDRSVQAYRRGRFMQLLGKAYRQRIPFLTDDELAGEILNKKKYLEPLQAAFRDNSPRPDEIYLYAIRSSAVVTNQRVFLLDKNGLTRPPIEIVDIALYKVRRSPRTEEIELSSGEIIRRKPKRWLDEVAMRKLIQRTNDPGRALSLDVPAAAVKSVHQAGTDKPSPAKKGRVASRSKKKTAKDDESFGSILAEFWPAFIGFCVFVMVLLANGAPIFEGGPAVTRWLSTDDNMSFFYLGIVAGVIAAVFAARSELIPSLFKPKNRNDHPDD